MARLANPLVNEVLIGTGSKDFWMNQDPKKEAQFLEFSQNPRLTAILNALFGTTYPTTGRNDIVTVFRTVAGGGEQWKNQGKSQVLDKGGVKPDRRKRLSFGLGWPLLL